MLPGAGLDRDETMLALYRCLIEIRRAHPSLSRGSYTAISTEGDLLVFQRLHEETGDVVTIAMNRGQDAVTATVPLPVQWNDTRVTDALSGDPIPSENGSVQFSVSPRSVRILTSDRANAP